MSDVSPATHMLQLFLVGIVTAGPVPLALAMVRKWGNPAHGAAENLLAAIVLGTGVQTLFALALGFGGLLDTLPVLLGACGLLVGGLLWLRRTGMPRLIPGAAAGPVQGGALVVVLIALGLGFADLVVHPTRNFDSLAYHLPVMARWIDAGHLEVFAQLGQVALYPSHWELVSTLVVLPVASDLLVSMPNLLAWLQLGLAIFVVARRLGSTRAAASIGAALVLLMPSVLSRLDAIQPDLAVAATFLTALAFALRPTDSGRTLDLLVIAVAVGMLPGLKLSGPIFVIFLAPLVLFGPGFGRLGPAALLRDLAGWDWRALAGLLGVVLALALSWYLRNWIALGNPLGDLEVALAGQEIFAGSVSGEELRRGALSSVFRPGAVEDWRVLGAVIREWLGIGALVLFAGGAIALVRGPRSRALAFTALLLLFCVVLYWRTPYSGDNGTHGWRVTPWIEVGLRYGFPALGLLGVLGAVGLSRSRWLEWGGLAVLVGTSVFTVLQELIPHVAVLIVVVVVAWTAGLVATGDLRLRTRTAAAAVVALLMLGIGLLAPARELRESRRAEQFGSIVDVLQDSLADDDVVAVVNSHKIYLAAGLDWRRRVEIVDLPAASGQEQAWMAELRARGVTAVLVGHQPPDPEYAAAVARVREFIRSDARFELLADYENLSRDLALFRLRQSSR